MILCPKCGKGARTVMYRGVECVVCACGFDERGQIDDPLGQRSSQRQKGRASPYRRGGGSRSR
ncbi:MAG: hypothetical protein ABIH41_06515 [Nanoarchaeota archaeon]